MTSNLAALAWRNVRSRRARSWLTILGIMIGVMAVVTLISVGTGAENAVLRQFRDIGLDIVFLTPRMGMQPVQRPTASHPGGTGSVGQPDGAASSSAGGASLGLDFDRLRRDVPEMTDIGLIGTANLRFSTDIVSGAARVLTPSREILHRFAGLLGGLRIAVGRMPGPGATDEVLVGGQLARDMGVSVGGEIRVEGVRFVVVGILAPASRTLEAIGGDVVKGESAEIFRAMAAADNAIIVPHEAAAIAWPGRHMPTLAAMRIRTGVSVTETIDKINAALAAQGASMTPISTQALADNVQRTLGMVKTILASIAAISLIVGAVGMMNTMYTAVLERTTEIGVLKSIGAKDRQVLGIFLIDSGLMGFAGGVLGILIGVGVSLAGTSTFGQLLGVTTFAPAFPLWLILGTLAASFGLGSLAGVWPAWHASKLDPVRALRSS